MERITALLVAVLAALIYAVGGYIKKTPPEQFSEEKFFVTVILGIIVGAASYGMGITFGAVEQLLASAGLIVYIEVWGKALYRRLKAWIETRK